MEKLGYKVVSRQGRALLSATSVSRRLRYRLRKAQRPRPEDGPLAVFTDVVRAKIFATEHKGCVYRCRYSESPHKSLWFNCGGINVTAIYVPSHTAFASSVTLLRRVL